MPEPSVPLPDNATAESVLTFIATKVVPPDWEFTFAKYDTSKGPAVRSEQERPRDGVPWRMSWGGVVEEAASGDLEALITRIAAHSEEAERSDIPPVKSQDVPNFVRDAQITYPQQGDICLLVCSRVTVPGYIWNEFKHIPMMDFRCAPSPRSLKLVLESMRELGQRNGVVLQTGRSYHYYGFKLFDDAGWREFMYRCLLLTPFVDPRYIGHRLIAGKARLRITASSGKPTVPFKVAELKEGHILNETTGTEEMWSASTGGTVS